MSTTDARFAAPGTILSAWQDICRLVDPEATISPASVVDRVAVLVDRAHPRVGERTTDGGMTGVLTRCGTCDGDGILFAPDPGQYPDIPPAPSSPPPRHAAPAHRTSPDVTGHPGTPHDATRTGNPDTRPNAPTRSSTPRPAETPDTRTAEADTGAIGHRRRAGGCG